VYGGALGRCNTDTPFEPRPRPGLSLLAPSPARLGRSGAIPPAANRRSPGEHPRVHLRAISVGSAGARLP